MNCTHSNALIRYLIVVQSLICVQLFALIEYSLPGFPGLHYLLEFAKLMFIESMISSNRLILCHPSYPQSFLESGSFPMSSSFTSGSQIIGISASTSVLPINILGWFPLGLTGLISLLSKQLWRVFSNAIIHKHQFFCTQPFLWSSSHIQHDYWKNLSFDYTLPANWCLSFLICCVIALS